MECLKCGAVVADEGAVYCCECGARLDGKKACPECGQFIDEKYTFCVFCGTRVDGKTKCPTCGVYHAGAFCPDCGESLTAVKSVHKKEQKNASAQASAGSQENGKVWNSVFAWVRASMGIALTVFALIFVFLIGLCAKVVGSAELLSEAGLNLDFVSNMKLYYYFGDAYKEVSELQKSGVFQSEIPVIGGYVHAILGTVITVATMACVVGFSIPAIIGFVKFATTRVENNGAKWGVRTAIAYLGGSVALRVLNTCAVALAMEIPLTSSTPQLLSVSTSVLFDKATGAGIALCIIFLVLYAVANFVGKGKQWKNKVTVLHCVFGVIAAVFAIVVCAVGQNAIVGTKMSEEGNMIKFALSQSSFAAMIASTFELSGGVAFYNTHVGQIYTSYVFAVVQDVAVFGVVACALCAIALRVFETESKTKGKTFVAILAVAFAVIQLAAGIVSQAIFQALIVEMPGVSLEMETVLTMGGAIVTVVFAGLLLATTIVHNKMAKKFE